MIKNSTKLDRFNNKLIKKENIPYKEALSLYDSMLEEAINLGVINSSNIMDGFEVDLKIARTINKLKP